MFRGGFLLLINEAYSLTSGSSFLFFTELIPSFPKLNAVLENY
jgi:hypothetical protein